VVVKCGDACPCRRGVSIGDGAPGADVLASDARGLQLWVVPVDPGALTLRFPRYELAVGAGGADGDGAAAPLTGTLSAWYSVNIGLREESPPTGWVGMPGAVAEGCCPVSHDPEPLVSTAGTESVGKVALTPGGGVAGFRVAL